MCSVFIVVPNFIVVTAARLLPVSTKHTFRTVVSIAQAPAWLSSPSILVVMNGEYSELRITGHFVAYVRTVFHESGQLAERHSDAHAHTHTHTHTHTQILILEVRT
jgi:hypothetical protein